MGAFLDATTQYKQKYGNVAEYNRQNGVQNHNPWAMMAVDLATTGIFLAAQTAGQWGSGTKNDGELSQVGQQIQNEIDAILKEGGYSDISDVATQHKAKTLELTQVQNNIKTSTQKIARIDTAIGNFNTQIQNARHDQAYYDQLDAATPGAGTAQKVKDEQLIAALGREITSLDSTKTEENQKLEAEQAKLDPLAEEINKLAKDYSDLETLGKQLRKAEGKTAIEDLTNETTQDLSKAFGKLDKAVRGGNQEQINKAALELEEAYQAYVGQLDGAENKYEKSYKLAEKYIAEAKKGTGKEK